MLTYRSFTLLLLITILSSCIKDRLPRATKSGKNTFGCKIDGKVFVPSEEGSSWVGAHPLIASNNRLDGFTLRARKFGSTTRAPLNVIIRLPYLEATGAYPLTTFGFGEYEIDYAGGPIYRTNNTYTGTVKITHCDIANRIYSGTFSFKAVDTITGKVVNITDGRFDVQWH